MDNSIIKSLICELDWSNEKTRQEKAIEELSHIDPLYFNLLFNWNKKSTWENAVKVISKIGFPRNKNLIPTLIELLRDLNWPGSSEALAQLLEIPPKEIMSFWENSITTAYEEKDFAWLTVIKSVLEEDLHCSSSDFSDSRVFDYLCKVEEIDDV